MPGRWPSSSAAPTKPPQASLSGPGCMRRRRRRRPARAPIRGRRRPGPPPLPVAPPPWPPPLQPLPPPASFSAARAACFSAFGRRRRLSSKLKARAHLAHAHGQTKPPALLRLDAAAQPGEAFEDDSEESGRVEEEQSWPIQGEDMHDARHSSPITPDRIVEVEHEGYAKCNPFDK
eukprot:scaffold11479_cov115-Isochrysis_galbana.AAC.1